MIMIIDTNPTKLSVDPNYLRSNSTSKESLSIAYVRKRIIERLSRIDLCDIVSLLIHMRTDRELTIFQRAGVSSEEDRVSRED